MNVDTVERAEKSPEDEQPFAEVEGAPKLTQARVTTTYGGDLDGEGTSTLVMAYHGDDATYAVRARDGTQVWRFPAGKYANPVVADKERVYLTGRAGVYAFAKPGSDVVKEYLKQQRRRERRQDSR